MMSADGAYAMALDDAEETEYYPVGRLDISFADQASVAAALENSLVAPEIKEYIAKHYEEALASGNTDTTLVLFSQNLLPKTRTTTTEYRTINGVQMRTDRLVAINRKHTGDIAKGHEVKTALNDVSNIVLAVAGLSSVVPIALAAGGISLMQALINAGQNLVTTSVNDSATIEIHSNVTTQWTYGYVGDWTLGLVTQKVDVTNTISRIHTTDENDVGTDTEILNADTGTQQTKDFASPWNVAYQNLNNPVEQWVSWKVYGNTFLFT